MESYRGINPFEPVDMTGLVDGVPDEWWKTLARMAISLLTTDFDGMPAGHGYRFNAGRMLVDRGVGWDGSSVVRDKNTCVLASLVHDLLCEAIQLADISRYRKWKLRRQADKIYARICRAQGMWPVRARIRYLGLRLFGGVYSALKG